MAVIPAAESCIKLLWTGGWDSTFSLLNMILNHNQRVKPIYLLDEDRKSTLHELKAMRDIRSCLSSNYNAKASNLLPTEVHLVSDIKPSPDLISAFDRLQNKSPIGIQYLWIAAFCDNHSVDDIVLSIHKDDRAKTAITTLESSLETIQNSSPPAVRIFNDAACDSDLYAIFHYYRLPLLKYTKLRMLEESRSCGFSSLLYKTWFCHDPKHGRPCGMCVPCKTTTAEGMGARVFPDRH